MKELIIVSCFLVFGFGFQTKAQVGFDGGIKFNTITSQVAGDTYAGFNKIGIGGGAFVSMVFSSSSSIKLEMLYSQKGSRNKPNTKKGDFSYFRLVLNYIELPISYVYHTEYIDFELGLYFGVLLNSSQDTGGGAVDVTPPYLNYDFGGQFGITYDIVEDKFAIGIRTSNSILPIRKAPVNSSPGLAFISGGFNSALYLSLEYSF